MFHGLHEPTPSLLKLTRQGARVFHFDISSNLKAVLIRVVVGKKHVQEFCNSSHDAFPYMNSGANKPQNSQNHLGNQQSTWLGESCGNRRLGLVGRFVSTTAQYGESWCIHHGDMASCFHRCLSVYPPKKKLVYDVVVGWDEIHWLELL